MPDPSLGTEAPARLERGDWGLVLGLTLAVLALYGSTAAPGIVAEGDGSEFVAAARVAGIPHAPGYPTYMLLASSVGCVVAAEHLARALNLLSALFGALTVGLVTLVALRLARRGFPEAGPFLWRLSAALTGLWLAVATEFWNQSLSAEVYTLGTAALALCIELLCPALLFPGTVTPRRRVLAALVAGLAIGVHYEVGGPCVVLVAGEAWWRRRELDGRSFRARGAAFLLGLSTFLYLPLRSLADPVLDFGDPETPGRLWRVLTMADMPTGKSFARTLAQLGQQLVVVARHAAGQWPVWVFALVLLGLVTAARRRSLLSAGGVGLSLVILNYAGILAMSNFALVEEEIYELRFLFLPAYLVLAWFAGLGCAGIVAFLARLLGGRVRTATVLAGSALTLALLPRVIAQRERLDKSQDHVLREYGANLLAAAEGPALLFAYGDNAWMPVLYLQVVEGLRPDVTLVAVGLLGNEWYRRALARHAPGLRVLDEAPGVAGLARANVGRLQLYHADPRVHGIRGFEEVPAGLLMRLVPTGTLAEVGASPPAPVLSSRYAVLDRRERSLLVNYVQAYVRRAEWCRARGELEPAEQAYLEGLRVPPPEPRLEEFHLVRSALLLDLGTLRASDGRIESAREAWESAVAEAPDTQPAEAARRRLNRLEPRPAKTP